MSWGPRPPYCFFASKSTERVGRVCCWCASVSPSSARASCDNGADSPATDDSRGRGAAFRVLPGGDLQCLATFPARAPAAWRFPAARQLFEAVLRAGSRIVRELRELLSSGLRGLRDRLRRCRRG